MTDIRTDTHVHTINSMHAYSSISEIVAEAHRKQLSGIVERK